MPVGPARQLAGEEGILYQLDVIAHVDSDAVQYNSLAGRARLVLLCLEKHSVESSKGVNGSSVRKRQGFCLHH